MKKTKSEMNVELHDDTAVCSVKGKEKVMANRCIHHESKVAGPMAPPNAPPQPLRSKVGKS